MIFRITREHITTWILIRPLCISWNLFVTREERPMDLAQGLCFMNESTVGELEEKYDLSRGMVPGMLLGTQTAEKSQ
jgi:hypothetical protein